MTVTKRIICFILTALFVFNFNIVAFAEENLLLGDTDSSGTVDISDARIALSMACGLSVTEIECGSICDIDFDGEITLDDAREVLKVAAGVTSEQTVYISDWQLDEEPTCTESGVATAYCAEKDVFITKILPPEGHSVIEATCTECAYCSECEAILRQPLGHTAYNDYCDRCNKYIEGKSSVYVIGHNIEFGSGAKVLTNIFGEPTEILEDSTGNDSLTHYVYAENLNQLTIFTLSDDKGVTGVYSVSPDYKIIASQTVSYDNVLGNKYLDDLTIVGYLDKLGSWEYYGMYATTDISLSYINENSDFKTCEKLIYYLTNSCRAINGEEELKYSKRVSKVARLHSEDMATKNYFSHDSADGRTLKDRIDEGNLTYRAIGENIAAGERMSVYDFNNGWYNSRGHRSNMLLEDFTHIGIGLAYDAHSRYLFYVTQDYLG